MQRFKGDYSPDKEAWKSSLSELPKWCAIETLICTYCCTVSISRQGYLSTQLENFSEDDPKNCRFVNRFMTLASRKAMAQAKRLPPP